MKVFGVGTIAGLNFLEALFVFILTWSFTQWLALTKELQRLGEDFHPEETGVYFLPFHLQQLLGETVVVAGLILLGALLAFSAFGLLQRRNWARKTTLALSAVRPALIFSLSLAFFEKSVGMTLGYIALIVWIAWFLCRADVKQEFATVQ